MTLLELHCKICRVSPFPRIFITYGWEPVKDAYLSDTVWNSAAGRFSGWGSLSVGSGFPVTILLGKGSSAGGVGCAWGSGGVDIRFFVAGSPRVARAGIFLFRSIAVVWLFFCGGDGGYKSRLGFGCKVQGLGGPHGRLASRCWTT